MLFVIRFNRIGTTYKYQLHYSFRSVLVQLTFQTLSLWNLRMKHINLFAGCSLLCLFVYASTRWQRSIANAKSGLAFKAQTRGLDPNNGFEPSGLWVCIQFCNHPLSLISTGPHWCVIKHRLHMSGRHVDIGIKTSRLRSFFLNQACIRESVLSSLFSLWLKVLWLDYQVGRIKKGNELVAE